MLKYPPVSTIFFVGAVMTVSIISGACKVLESGRPGSSKTIQYHHFDSYSFGEPLVISSRNPAFSWPQFSERIRHELSFLLPTQGLDSSGKQGDLVIYFYAVVQPVEQPPLVSYYIGWAAEPFVSQGERFERYPSNTFVIDFVDANTRELVWRGSTSLPFDNPDLLYELMPERLAKLIQRYPSPPSSD